MRIAIVVLALSCAVSGIAGAQDFRALQDMRDAELHAQADLARQREVELNNRLSTFEARLQTDQALRDIEAMRQRPALPTIYDPRGLPPARAPIPAGGLVSIPDDKLAASNARVREAAANRR
jgi:hypothetical protein